VSTPNSITVILRLCVAIVALSSLARGQSMTTVIDVAGTTRALSDVTSTAVSWYPALGSEKYQGTGLAVRVDQGYEMLVPFVLAKEIKVGKRVRKDVHIKGDEWFQVRVRFFDDSEITGSADGYVTISGEGPRGRVELKLKDIATISRDAPAKRSPINHSDLDADKGALAHLTLHNGTRLEGVRVWRYYEESSGYINVSSYDHYETKLFLRVKDGLAISTRQLDFKDLKSIRFRPLKNDEATVDVTLRTGGHMVGSLPPGSYKYAGPVTSRDKEAWSVVLALSTRGYLMVELGSVASLEFR